MHQADAPGGELLSLQGISCPSTTLCVAVDGSGNVLTSTHPTSQTAAWTSVDVTGGRTFTGISCPTTTLCVAIDGDGEHRDLDRSDRPGLGMVVRPVRRSGRGHLLDFLREPDALRGGRLPR